MDKTKQWIDVHQKYFDKKENIIESCEKCGKKELCNNQDDYYFICNSCKLVEYKSKKVLKMLLLGKCIDSAVFD